MARRRVLPWEATPSSSVASRRTVDAKPVERDSAKDSKRKREPETASDTRHSTIANPRREAKRYRPPPSSTQVLSSPSSSSSSDTDPSDTHMRTKPPFLPTELMQPNDKAYRMVEDEFLETVHLFTAAVHEAELRLLESAGAKDTGESPRPALSSDDIVPQEEVRDEFSLCTLGTLMHAPRISASRTPAPTKIKPSPPKPSTSDPDSQDADDAETHLAEPDRPPPEPASDNDDIMEIIRLTQVPSSSSVPSAAPSSSTSPTPTTAAAVAATATQSFDYDSDIDHFIRETAETTKSEPKPKPKPKKKAELSSTTSNPSTTTTDAPVSIMMHLLAQAETQPDKTTNSRRPVRKSRKPVFRYCL